MSKCIKILIPAIVFCVFLSPGKSEAAVQANSFADVTELQNQIKILQAQLQALLNQRSSNMGAVVDLQANGSDENLSFSGKKKINVAWNTSGVRNCHIYVARAKSYKVRDDGERIMSIHSSSPYVTLTCNDAITGNEIHDSIYIYDPKGTPDLTVSMEAGTLNVSAVASLIHPKMICSGDHLGTITWGDGQKDIVVAELKSGECSLVASDQQIHSYTKVGNYTVIFKSITGVSKKVKIDVGG